MAVLSDNRRIEAWAALMRQISDGREPTALLKAQWRTLVNDLDQGYNDNAATINGWISQPVRGLATAREKAMAGKVILDFRFQDGS